MGVGNEGVVAHAPAAVVLHAEYFADSLLQRRVLDLHRNDGIIVKTPIYSAEGGGASRQWDLAYLGHNKQRVCALAMEGELRISETNDVKKREYLRRV